MTTATDVLVDAFTRVHDDLPDVLDGLAPADLLWRPDADANPIAWLVWHLTRVQDDHLAGVAGSDQIWTTDGWADRFALPYDVGAHGWGQTSAEVGAFSVDDTTLLTGYHDAVHRRTLAILAGLGDADYARVVDERWDPPVTAAVRLVSVVNDISQHLGQAAYVAGLARRR
jgi:hypothetical protein